MKKLSKSLGLRFGSNAAAGRGTAAVNYAVEDEDYGESAFQASVQRAGAARSDGTNSQKTTTVSQSKPSQAVIQGKCQLSSYPLRSGKTDRVATAVRASKSDPQFHQTKSNERCKPR